MRGPEPDSEAVRELRRRYHDHIATLRERSASVLHSAADGVEAATRALLESDARVAHTMREVAAEASSIAAQVDSEVIGLLALESPVARDLRIILAARDVTQLSLLCVGLNVALAARSVSAGSILGPDLRTQLNAVGSGAGGALRGASAAWTALDPVFAGEVAPVVSAARATQTAFFSALLSLRDVPMEAALDLGMAARAYDRLTDHASEIAERVLFAVCGTPDSAAPTSAPGT